MRLIDSQLYGVQWEAESNIHTTRAFRGLAKHSWAIFPSKELGKSLECPCDTTIQSKHSNKRTLNTPLLWHNQTTTLTGILQ